ncbi:MAG: tRNA (guanosine(46)-N7)-methyltransferase TrmB [Bacteroidales bacterium]|nr:tRNA (guanosine(46)-N7)-methyltransferase TrmB [Bacteroidales bacterium]
MGKKKKLVHFAENETFGNLFQLQYEGLIKGFDLKGNWSGGFFKNENELVIELGCGKGEYTTGLAQRYPDKNFIGLDIQGARLWRGLKTAAEGKLKNVAFIRVRINLSPFCFGKNEVSEIWITFPDPRARKSDAKKRLTSPEFLERYKTFLKPGGIIHVKTDNIIFFENTLDVIGEGGHELLYATYDVYAEGFDNELTQIETFYEKKWRANGTKIKYLKFRLQ